MIYSRKANVRRPRAKQVYNLVTREAQSREPRVVLARCKIRCAIRDLSEISRGEGGGWKQREGHNFLRLTKGRGHEKWALKRGRVMQIYARDHVEVHPKIPGRNKRVE